MCYVVGVPLALLFILGTSVDIVEGNWFVLPPSALAAAGSILLLRGIARSPRP